MFSKPEQVSVGKFLDKYELYLPITQKNGHYTHILRQNTQYQDEGLITTHNPEGHGFEYAKGIQTQIQKICPSYPIRLAQYNSYVWALKQSQSLSGKVAVFAYNSLPIFWGAHLLAQQTKKSYPVTFYHGGDTEQAQNYNYDSFPDLFPARLKQKDIQKILLKESLLSSQYQIDTLPHQLNDPLCLAIIGTDQPELEDQAAELFWEQLSPSGLMMIDDFGAFNARPERQNIWQEFAAQRQIPLLPLPTGQAILIK